MQIKPILSALRRHKAGTILIALQIALTLAIICNALFIIRQRVEHLSRPTGIAESEILTIQNRWVGAKPDVFALTKTDVAALRQVPGVADAYATNSFPLRQGGWSMGLRLNPDAKKKALAQSAIYFVDDHALSTLGVKLVAGRNFRADEISTFEERSPLAPPVVIITKALAEKLFPNASSLGKTLYVSDDPRPSTVIGVVDSLEVPWAGSWSDNFDQYSTLVPLQLDNSFTTFVIRVHPGQLEAVTKAAPAALFAANRMRVIPEKTGLRTFAEVRERAYKSDRGMAIMMGIVCAVLLLITGAGIVGLTSFWVGQRRKQIGVRRALGATRNDILSYFLTENLLIGVAGVVVGALLAYGMNQWMMTQFEMARLSLAYVCTGVVVLLLLGQAAVLAPAVRASRVSPVEATRSV
jgi:putative ABC transport system permease protein